MCFKHIKCSQFTFASCAPFLMVAMIVAQVSLLIMTRNAGMRMKFEWGEVMKKDLEQQILTARMNMFWGPVHLIIPTSCDIVESYAKKVHEVSEEIAEEDEKLNLQNNLNQFKGELDQGQVMQVNPLPGESPRIEQESQATPAPTVALTPAPTLPPAPVTTAATTPVATPAATAAPMPATPPTTVSPTPAPTSAPTPAPTSAPTPAPKPPPPPAPTPAPKPIPVPATVPEAAMDEPATPREESNFDQQNPGTPENPQAPKAISISTGWQAKKDPVSGNWYFFNKAFPALDEEAIETERSSRLLRGLSADSGSGNDDDGRELEMMTWHNTTTTPAPKPSYKLTNCPGWHADGEGADDDDSDNSTRMMQIHYPGYGNKYFGMIFLTQLKNWLLNVHISAEKMYVVRFRTWWVLLGTLPMTMVLKYSTKLLDLCAGCSNNRRLIQLWNNGRTTCDKLLESLMVHFTAIVFCLVQQMTLCTLFLTIWQEDHFIMTFTPGTGFAAFFGFSVIMTCYITVDRIMGWMLKCGDGYIYLFWSIWIIGSLLVVVPMVGYLFYMGQFVWELTWRHMIRTEPFSLVFVENARWCMRYCWIFIGLSIADALLILKIDLQTEAPRSSQKQGCC
mmetsp:Transcript_72717/g.137429  ORF Transcript_72717/g.137429 Transcript_72717/m.137429 type:complete len:620 (-) Transcript_72717:127-1986(-)